MEGRVKTVRFGRWGRRRADVGIYLDPPIRPLAPIEAVIDDALAISLVAVRLAVKNRIIVLALRDHADFDEAALTQFTRFELLQQADENRDTAARLASLPSASSDARQEHEVRRAHQAAIDRRPDVHRALESELLLQADDEDKVAAILRGAQAEAAEELNREVRLRLTRQRVNPDENYRAERQQRLNRLIEEDLNLLSRRSEDKG
jgi:hypothetical protein